MPSAFLRSPADEGITPAAIRGRRRHTKLLQEDVDQDGTNYERRDEGVGPQRETENPLKRENAVDNVAKGQDTPGTGGSVSPSMQESDGTQPMSMSEVQSAVHKMAWDAIEYVDQELSPQRALAAKYYKGEALGNEEDGRSKVVDTVLRDTVLMMMPSLMRIFFGADRAIEFSPTSADPQDIEKAAQATEFLWDVTVMQDNDGYLAIYEWLKDALVKKLGIMKSWYDETEESRAYDADFLSSQDVSQLANDPEIRIEAIEPSVMSQPGFPIYRVEYTQTKKSGAIRLIALPPEEYIFTRGSRTTSSAHHRPGVALFVGHRTELTRSQLLNMGVSQEDIDTYGFKDAALDHNQEEIERQAIVKPDTSTFGPVATQKALYIEGYPYLDLDGDGIAELCKVVMLGPSFHVISAEPTDSRPFSVICPDPEPHTIIGQCVSDWTMDLQKIQSMVLRSILDSLALSINPRIGFVEGAVSLEDILNPELGSPIRMSMLNAITPIEHNFVGREGIAVRELLNDIRENRTGTTKASAGLDADALQSSTKAAVAATVTSAQAHIEMIARTFAETGFKQLFRRLLELLVSHPPRARIVKFRGKYVEMDPSRWDATLDVKVKVAIGAGLDEDKYQALLETREEMKAIFQMWGPNNPIVTPRQYRDINVRMLKLRGQMDAENFYSEVPPDWQPPPPPEGDPNMVIAQAEMEKAKTAQQAAMAKAQLEQQKHEMLMQEKISKLELQLQQQQEDVRLKIEQMVLTAQTQIAVAELNAKATLSQGALQTAVDEMRVHLEHVATLHDSQVKASASAIQGNNVEVEHDPDTGRVKHLKIRPIEKEATE